MSTDIAIKAGTVTRVQVTGEDIANGEREKCEKCPIALAIARAVPGSFPWVDCDIVYAGEFSAELPAVAVGFIRQYDNEGAVVPFEFNLTWEDV